MKKKNIEHEEETSKKQVKTNNVINSNPLGGIKRRNDFRRRQSVIHVEGAEVDIEDEKKKGRRTRAQG